MKRIANIEYINWRIISSKRPVPLSILKVDRLETYYAWREEVLHLSTNMERAIGDAFYETLWKINMKHFGKKGVRPPRSPR